MYELFTLNLDLYIGYGAYVVYSDSINLVLIFFFGREKGSWECVSEDLRS